MCGPNGLCCSQSGVYLVVYMCSNLNDAYTSGMYVCMYVQTCIRMKSSVASDCGLPSVHSGQELCAGDLPLQ